MIREAMKHYPFVSLSILALALFIGAYVRALYCTLRQENRAQSAEAALLPLEDA